ncbi:unnamed protein product [Fusarium graminearum]|nr:unnamed protein product [Fusarium graminearum]VTO83678.1 unnamed protein product [Fusarium graminearum]
MVLWGQGLDKTPEYPSGPLGTTCFITHQPGIHLTANMGAIRFRYLDKFSCQDDIFEQLLITAESELTNFRIS